MKASDSEMQAVGVPSGTVVTSVIEGSSPWMATDAMHDQLVKAYVGGSHVGYLSDGPAQVHALRLEIEGTTGRFVMVRELNWTCECGWTRTDGAPPGVEVIDGRVRWGHWTGEPVPTTR